MTRPCQKWFEKSQTIKNIKKIRTKTYNKDNKICFIVIIIIYCLIKQTELFYFPFSYVSHQVPLEEYQDLNDLEIIDVLPRLRKISTKDR